MNTSNPEFLGPYRLLNVVNTSPSSTIWQAYHDAQQKFFALKALLTDHQRQPRHQEYLKREHAVGSKLDHQRLIKIFEYKVDRGIPFLAMEWFSCPNLKQRIRQGIDSYRHLVPTIIEQSAESLAYLGQQGWVHRDVKPENFMVNDQGDVKLIDFALAQRSKGRLAKLLSFKSKIQGTRSYMSPEQIRGQALDGRADLYSLACTVFELLAGKPPFTGDSPDEVLVKHLKTSPPPVTATNENVTQEFAELIRKAMAKDPADRPKSAEAFLREFRATRIFTRDPKPPPKAEETEA